MEKGTCHNLYGAKMRLSIYELSQTVALHAGHLTVLLDVPCQQGGDQGMVRVTQNNLTLVI